MATGSPDGKAIRREPDWRHRQAINAAARGVLLLPSRADRLVREVSVYRYRERLCSTNSERRRLCQSTLGKRLAGVLCIADDATRRLPSYVEALVLGRQTAPQIAKRTGLLEADIDAYQQLCFDVGDNLEDQSYIRARAILPELACGPPADAARRCGTKFLAYACGATALDELCPMLYPWRRDFVHPSKLVDAAAGERVLDMIATLIAPSAATIGSAETEAIEKYLREHLGRFEGVEMPRNALEEMLRDTVRSSMEAGYSPLSSPVPR